MKTFLLLIFWNLWFINFSSRTSISPILPIIEEELGLSHAMAGSFFLFLSIGYTATLIFAGFLSSRVGYKRAIGAGFLVISIAEFLLRFAQSYWSLGFSFFLVGIGSGIYMPCIIPIMTTTFAPDRWGRTIALHDTAASFSIFIVPSLVAIALGFFQWRTLFLILSGACIAGLTVFLVWSPDPRAREEEGSRLFGLLRRRDFWVMAILWIFAVAANIGVYNVVPLFLVKERGLSLGAANMIFGISRAGGVFVAPLAGFMADRYGAGRVLRVAFLVTGLSTVGIALAWNFSLLVGMLILQAFASLGFFPVGLLAISKLTCLEERSAFIGASMAAGVTLGFGLAPVLLGAAADAWNFEIGILILGILTTFSTLTLKELKGI